ncbi:MAG: DNA topoisomerase, partial [Desulfobacula sp.]|nr:DNA topoisomerase [Desulfobacula sp.]
NPKGVKDPVPGVKIEKRFQPSYEILKGKEQVMKDLKNAAKDALASGGTVWFATDLDREGEAIAWHIAQELKIESKDAKRVIFTAITKKEIEKAFENPLAIDEERVNAQQARRALDYLVGFTLSPLLWKKVRRGLSAGRVQSPALRMIVERELEIEAFVPQEYWTIEADAASKKQDFEVIVAGGIVRSRDCGITGEAAIKFIRQFKVDVGIIGISGIELDGTLLDYDFKEVYVARAIIENSRKVYLVADHSKFDRNAMVKLGHIKEIDTLITDKAPPELLMEILRKNDVHLELAQETLGN